jgi:hypothetical protein
MKKSLFLVSAVVLVGSLSSPAHAWPFRWFRHAPAPVQYAPAPYTATPTAPAYNPATASQSTQAQGQGYRTYSYQPSVQPAMGGYAPLPARSGTGYRPSSGFRDAGAKVRGEF